MMAHAHAPKTSDSRTDKNEARESSQGTEPKGEDAPESAPEKACRAKSDPTDEANTTQGEDP